jgi:hypothetical protein
MTNIEQPISYSIDQVKTNNLSERATPLMLAGMAIEDALSRLKNAKPEAIARNIRGITNRFKPAVEESVIISEQLRSDEYRKFTNETIAFLGGRLKGWVVCPDGRILPYLSEGEPRVVTFHQKLAGIPQTRPSSFDGKPLLNDGTITGTIISVVKDRKIRYPNVEIEEELGPHINSDEPTHGCGALKIEISKHQVPEFGMRFGGIDKYYEDLKTEGGDAFHAFDNLVGRVPELRGIHSITFDITHDAYSQGLIVGLKDTYPEFDENKTLRENLLDLHRNRKIVMTEMLDHAFHTRINELDNELFGDLGGMNPLDPKMLAKNLIRIGNIARQLTLEEERKNFRFIPEHLLENASDGDKRSLGYTLLRNIVYRTLSDIEPGAHALLEHNEQWIRIGYGGPLNIDNVSFVLRIPPGDIRDQDIAESQALHPILRGALAKKGIKVTDEAIVVVVGALFDKTRRATPEIADEDHEIIYSTIGNNAAKLRLANKDDIENGAMVVIAVIFDPDGTIAEIVR